MGKKVDIAHKKKNHISVDDLGKERTLGSRSKRDVINKMKRNPNGDKGFSDNAMSQTSSDGGFENAVLKRVYHEGSKYDVGELFVAEAEIGIGSGQYYELDSLDLLAIHIIDYVVGGALEFAQLSLIEQNILFRYFYRHNPILGRIIDLHTNLPTSKIRKQVPRDCSEIVRDYIDQFYDSILDRISFHNNIRYFIRDSFLYDVSVLFVDDYFDGDRELQDLDEYPMNPVDMTDENKAFIEKIESQYASDPSSVNVEDRMKYLNIKFSGNFEHYYKGPKRSKTVNFWEIDEYLENKDIDYTAIKMITSEGLKTALSDIPRNVNPSEYLMELGYSEGIVNLLAVNQELGIDIGKSLLVDDDDLSGLPFVVVMEGQSIVRRVISELLEWEMSKRAFLESMKRVGKVGRVVTAEALSDGQVEILRQEVEAVIVEGDHSIVANYPIEWQNVEEFVKEELTELSNARERLVDQISVGLGIPSSILTGESQYSGDVVKLEILNTEYLALKLIVQEIISKKMFKPIALRKGFINFDSWGNTIILYPKLSFSRVSIRDDAVYDILFSLYQKGSLPVSVLYELLNLEVDDVERGIQEDLFTPRDPNFNEIMRDIYTSSVDSIVSSTDVIERIKESLRLEDKPIEEEIIDEENQDNRERSRYPHR